MSPYAQDTQAMWHNLKNGNFVLDFDDFVTYNSGANSLLLS